MSEGAQMVLIIDDDPLWCMLLSDYLAPASYEISVAECGTDGLRMMILYHPDLIICDIGMPHGNGYEVVEQVKRDEVLRRIPILACTGSGLLDTHEMAIEIGFDGALAKSATPESIRETVASFLEKR